MSRSRNSWFGGSSKEPDIKEAGELDMVLALLFVLVVDVGDGGDGVETGAVVV